MVVVDDDAPVGRVTGHQRYERCSIPLHEATTGSISFGAVDRLDSSWDRLLDFAIDTPKLRTLSIGHTLMISGWVLGRDRDVRSVEVLYRDLVLGIGHVDGRRSDLSAAYPNSPQVTTCGFIVAVDLLGLPSNVKLSVQAVLDDGRRAPFAVLHGERSLLEVDCRVRPQPLLVTGLGRAGSTYLMRLLLEHPQMTGVNSYPYEARVAAYWAHALRVLAHQADYERSAHPDTFHQNLQWVGHNPYNSYGGNPLSDWLTTRYLCHLVSFVHEVTHGFYLDLYSRSAKTIPKYFAEKSNPGLATSLIREVYPDAREIFLVRDFRDMLCSIFSFNRKRGYAAFGRQNVATDDEFITNLGRSAQRLLDDWTDRRTSSILVRYEDLIRNGCDTIPPVLEYLGVASGRQMASRMLDGAHGTDIDLDRHRTSKDSHSSIGRWRSELTPSQTRACEVAFEKPLTAFGYI